MIHNYRVWAQDGSEVLDPVFVYEVLAASPADALAETISAVWHEGNIADMIRERHPEAVSCSLPGGSKLIAVQTPALLEAIIDRTPRTGTTS